MGARRGNQNNKHTERQQQKNLASKYDFVKVRVHLSQQHYYVLSRFLLCRMLMAAQIDYGHALRIALDLKKRLIDKSQTDISQQELQKELFDLIGQHGYGHEHITWYNTMASFYHNRIPLVVLLAGTGSTGKSTIAMRLSERLNLSSVLKTDVVYNLMHTIIDGAAPPRIWSLKSDDECFALTIDRECSLVCRGLKADVCKSIADGKSIIIEGELVNHELLDQMNAYIQPKETQSTIVAPFLLIPKDAPSHHRIAKDARSTDPSDDFECVFERINEWQAALLQANQLREQSQQPSFHVIKVDMNDLSTSIDAIQSIVLDRIATEMAVGK